MEMKTPCLGTHSGSLNKTLVARTHNLGASGDRWAAALTHAKRYLTGSNLFQLILQMFCFRASMIA